MSATCDECVGPWFEPVSLCPLHAEAEAMRDALRRAVEALSAVDEWRELLRQNCPEIAHHFEWRVRGALDAARPILARPTPVDGEQRDGEGGRRAINGALRTRSGGRQCLKCGMFYPARSAAGMPVYLCTEGRHKWPKPAGRVPPAPRPRTEE